MSVQHIKIIQLFNAPVDTIFGILADHEAFGKVMNTKIKRVVDSQSENKEKSMRDGLKRLSAQYE